MASGEGRTATHATVLPGRVGETSELKACAQQAASKACWEGDECLNQESNRSQPMPVFFHMHRKLPCCCVVVLCSSKVVCAQETYFLGKHMWAW